MTFILEIKEEAEQDINEVFTWYEKARKGLGKEFLMELNRNFELILQNPDLFGIRYNRLYRFVPLKRFPYKIIYSKTETSIIIFAVFHSKRSSNVWEKRV